MLEEVKKISKEFTLFTLYFTLLTMILINDNT